MTISRGRPLVANIALAILYAAIGHATLTLGEAGGVELRRIIWMSSGVAVTAALLAPFPLWIGAGLGGALATALSGSSAVVVVGTGLANALEVLLAVALLRRTRFSIDLGEVRDVVGLIFLAAGVAAAAGAALSVTSLWAAGGVSSAAFGRVLVMWWLTHAMGILLVTPVGLSFGGGGGDFARRGPLEIVGVLAAVATASWIPFSGPRDTFVSQLFVLPVPFLLWASIRLGMRGAAIAGFIASSCAIIDAVRHVGPLTGATPNMTLTLTSLFTSVVMIATLVSAANVAKIHRARAAHEAGEARLRAVLDGAHEGIVVTDDAGFVTHVNRAVREVWPRRLSPPEAGQHLHASVQALSEVVRNAGTQEVLAVRPAEPVGRGGTLDFVDGHTWVVRVDPLRLGSAHSGCIWSFDDVTARLRDESERRELQEQVLHGQKLESLGVMAGGIAHDFNNLLMAIRTRAELVRMTEEVPEDATEDVDAILRTVDQAAGLCRQMLIFAGRGEIEVRAVELTSSVREVQDLLRVSVSRQVELDLDLPEGNLWVDADVAQLRQVAINLVSNASDAVEATGRAGSVRVRTAHMALGPEWFARAVVGKDLAAGEYCLLEVTDDGVGMDEDVRRQIFDPFYSSKGTGRGLGLSSVLGIIRRHRGALVVESRPGAGTRFVVALPRRLGMEDVSRLPDALPAPRELEGRTILVVDDDDNVRIAVARMLSRLGMSVREASDGDAALAWLAADVGREIDIVLLDLTMPRRSGPSTLAAMRAAGVQVPVIIASGYSAESVPDGEGVVAIVQKPYRSDVLRRLLTSVLVRA